MTSGQQSLRGFLFSCRGHYGDACYSPRQTRRWNIAIYYNIILYYDIIIPRGPGASGIIGIPTRIILQGNVRERVSTHAHGRPAARQLRLTHPLKNVCPYPRGNPIYSF